MENKNYDFCVKELYDKYGSFFLDKKQAKDVLNLSESTFDRYISIGKAPVSFQENGKVLYTIFDMAEYITKKDLNIWNNFTTENVLLKKSLKSPP